MEKEEEVWMMRQTQKLRRSKKNGGREGGR